MISWIRSILKRISLCEFLSDLFLSRAKRGAFYVDFFLIRRKAPFVIVFLPCPGSQTYCVGRRQKRCCQNVRSMQAWGKHREEVTGSSLLIGFRKDLVAVHPYMFNRTPYGMERLTISSPEIDDFSTANTILKKYILNTNVCQDQSISGMIFLFHLFSSDTEWMHWKILLDFYGLDYQWCNFVLSCPYSTDHVVF